jgi:hypothetical protein
LTTINYELDGEIVSIQTFGKFAHLLTREQQELDLNHLEGQQLRSQQYPDWETHGEVCQRGIFNIRAQKI